MTRTTATLAILAVIAALSSWQDHKGGTIPSGCCSGIRGLNSAARTTPDRQQACSCLKSLAHGANPSYAKSIPSKCGINIPYSFNPNIDCTKVS
ncbi:hypothetical protein QJS10_CPB21g01584 [Acorus calamus]|uniref:Non-specific lipid-transfer protein n=1 Tax=Acorus calamus TaxID=4465 RepID=A0AAV9C724_ACOCL|nr:hypothetical protein QJS10_CPB21g01584 [Acorus calamus]